VWDASEVSPFDHGDLGAERVDAVPFAEDRFRVAVLLAAALFEQREDPCFDFLYGDPADDLGVEAARMRLPDPFLDVLLSVHVPVLIADEDEHLRSHFLRLEH
jgi:hypothetical protein